MSVRHSDLMFIEFNEFYLGLLLRDLEDRCFKVYRSNYRYFEENQSMQDKAVMLYHKVCPFLLLVKGIAVGTVYSVNEQ